MIEKDKIIHFFVCYGIVVLGSLFLCKVGVDRDRSVSIASLFALAAAFGKEFYDKYVKHSTFDTNDIIADILGIITSVIAILIVK